MELTLQMNSMSSLSMSFTTMIFILLRKCRARSLRASLRWEPNTLMSRHVQSDTCPRRRVRTWGWTSGWAACCSRPSWSASPCWGCRHAPPAARGPSGRSPTPRSGCPSAQMHTAAQEGETRYRAHKPASTSQHYHTNTKRFWIWREHVKPTSMKYTFNYSEFCWKLRSWSPQSGWS